MFFFYSLSVAEKGAMVISSPLFLEDRICTKFIYVASKYLINKCFVN